MQRNLLQKLFLVSNPSAYSAILSPVFAVSAGFDAAEGDPLGECDVTPRGFAQMTSDLCGLADGRVVVVLEVCGSSAGRDVPSPMLMELNREDIT